MDYKGSGKICCIVGCRNSARKRKLWLNSVCKDHGIACKDCPCLLPFSLHTFPKEDNLRRKWMAAVNRKDYMPGKGAAICSVHFLDGKPTETNCIPQLNLGYSKKVSFGRPAPKRMKRQQPVKKKCILDVGIPGLDDEGPALDVVPDELVPDIPVRPEGPQCVFVQTDIPSFATQAVQWEDPILTEHSYYKKYFHSTTSKMTQTYLKSFSYLDLSDSDCKFFTGVSITVFRKLLEVMSTCSSFPFSLAVGDQLLIVFMRLRLGLIYADLARRFDISTTLVCRIVTTWLPVLSKELRFLIFWLPRDTIRNTLPEAFLKNYPKTTCIIDCTEVFMNRPTLLCSRAQTYSTYKHHNTVKALVCISPTGYFMFISKCYGGRASDKFIVTSCGILDYLLPGDEVMADRGFTIDLEVASRQARLNIPAFTRDKKQLSEKEVTETRRIATVRIHVERAIARLKNFRILKNTISSRIVKKQVDDIFIVCAALCNLQSPLLKE